MLGELPRHTRHVLGGPCENVPILMEEVDELAFLFAVEVAPDRDELLVWLACVQRYLLAVLRCLELGLSSRTDRDANTVVMSCSPQGLGNNG